jgi:hypothetical protein
MLRFSVGLEIESLRRFKSWSWIHLYKSKNH